MPIRRFSALVFGPGPRGAAAALAALAMGVGTTAAAGGFQPEDEPERPIRESRIEPATGRHLGFWARSPQCDFLHMRLEVTIADMETTRLEAVQTLQVRGLAGARQSLTLDAIGLEIEAVWVDGREARFTNTGRLLTIEFPGAPLRGGEERSIRIGYHADYPIADGLGLNWSLGDPGGASETDRFAQIHTQGQSENNSRWFPCHDAPNERMSTELLVRVPEGYTVLSNGALVWRGAADSDLVTWHYLQERAHPAYLVSLVVGVFDAVELAGPELRGPTAVPMTVYGPVGSAERLRRVFEGTPAMLAFFEAWLDEAYPWARYDQVCVRNFHSGGMENTSVTTMYEEAARSSREREEDLISHELAHMWFGDLITCRTWDHLWLNEGWATYGEVLWREERARQEALADGLDARAIEEEARRAMLEYMLQLMRVQRRFNRARAPMDPALVSNLYSDPETVFERADDAYNKGAAVLHMLRMTLGEELFQRGTRLYVDRHRDGLVETDDLRRCFEEVSGRSLERFFTQWALRPGLPRLDVSIQWDDAAGELVVHADQRQRIDADNPAYAFDLPIELRVGERATTVLMPIAGRSEVLRLALEKRPEQVAVDPGLSVFAATRVEKDLTWWHREALEGPTIAARLEAVEALGVHPEAGTGELLLLARLAGGRGEPASLRRSASRAVASLVARGLGANVLPIAWSSGDRAPEDPS